MKKRVVLTERYTLENKRIGDEAMKNRNQVGKMISYERNRAGMTVDELCRGLCSRTFLQRVESGERACEKILADALLQRVGVSADKFVYMINPEEQDWLVLREELIAAVESGVEKDALPLMESYRKLTTGKSKLHRQLLLLFEVVLSWKNNGDRAVMREKLQAAWHITMERTAMEEIVGEKLTLTEFVLAMMYIRILEEQDCIEEAVTGYRRLLAYLDGSSDEEDRVKLYPQIAYRLVLLLLKKNQVSEVVAIAERTIDLLKIRGRLFYLRQFLEIIVEYGEAEEEEKRKITDICVSLKWLYEKYGVEEETWIWEIPFGMAEVELCGNLIRSRRKALGMSQEALAEGICDPVSISRIECGKVAPKRQIFQMLMERIGMTGGSFETVVQVEGPELFDLAIQISVLLDHSKGAEAEPLIARLEQQTKRADKFSKQYLLSMKALSLYSQRKISAEEHAKLQEEALYLTLPRIGMEKLEEWSFSSQEVNIINLLSYSYGKMGREEDIIRLLQMVQKQYERKPFGLIHYVSGYELTMRNLGNILGNVGRYEEAIAAADRGIRLGLQAGRGNILSTTLYDYGWDMEQMWVTGQHTKEESLPYVKASYALNLLFGRKQDCDFLRTHMEENYS